MDLLRDDTSRDPMKMARGLRPAHPVETWYRDAKMHDIVEGTGQIQRRIIAKSLTGIKRDSR